MAEEQVTSGSASQAEKRQKTDAVRKEAKSSKKSTSDAKADIQPVGEVTVTDPAESEENATKESEKVAKGDLKGDKAKKSDLETNDDGEVVAGQEAYSLPEGYDPYADPVIPSSARPRCRRPVSSPTPTARFSTGSRIRSPAEFIATSTPAKSAKPHGALSCSLMPQSKRAARKSPQRPFLSC